MDTGGFHLTKFLAKMLNERGKGSFFTTSEMEIVADIKETSCYVKSGSFNQQNRSYELPDGQSIEVALARGAFSVYYYMCL
jgi:hypothetical protein